jgi:hypothetical protein
VPSYTVGYIDVYRNGALLGSADFTATSGTTVVLANAASEGDLVETVSFFVSSVINAIPAVAGAVTSSYLLDASVTQAKLAAGVAGNGPAFSAFQSTAQTALTANTSVKLLFQTEEFDTANAFDSTTNYRFQPQVAGYYQINGAVQFAGTTNAGLVQIFKNGSVYKNGTYISPSSAGTLGFPSSVVSSLVFLNGSTDFVELYGFTVASLAPNTGIQNTYFNGAMVRAA